MKVGYMNAGILGMIFTLSSGGVTAATFKNGMSGGNWTNNGNWVGSSPDLTERAIFEDFTGEVKINPGSQAVGVEIEEDGDWTFLKVGSAVLTLSTDSDGSTGVSRPDILVRENASLTVESPVEFSQFSTDGAHIDVRSGALLTFNESVAGTGQSALNVKGIVNANGDFSNVNGMVRRRIKLDTSTTLTLGSTSTIKAGNLDLTRASSTLVLNKVDGLDVGGIRGQGTFSAPTSSSGSQVDLAGINVEVRFGGNTLDFSGHYSSSGTTDWLLDVNTDSASGELVEFDEAFVLNGNVKLTNAGTMSGGDIVLFSGPGITLGSTTLTGAPANMKLIQGTNQILLSIPEVSTTLPLLAILLPLIGNRRRARQS